MCAELNGVWVSIGIEWSSLR